MTATPDCLLFCKLNNDEAAASSIMNYAVVSDKSPVLEKLQS